MIRILKRDLTFYKLREKEVPNEEETVLLYEQVDVENLQQRIQDYQREIESLTNFKKEENGK